MFVDSASILLHQEVQQFYAQQMQFLDTGDAQSWGRTFTEDGLFDDGRPDVRRGRAAITEFARSAHADRSGRGLVLRHWIGMVVADEQPDGTIHTVAYALVVQTPRGGKAEIRLSTLCRDVLVRSDGELLVRSRRVSRDDAA